MKQLSCDSLSDKVIYQEINDSKYQAIIYNPIPSQILKRIYNKSWNINCPVPLSDLSYLKITYLNLERENKLGELIVHKKIAFEVAEIFQELFHKQFIIERMELIENFGCSDELSMEANNSSSFCTREVTNKPGLFSKHSYGIAIDVNPRFNPYIKGEILLPKNAIEYIKRDASLPGCIVEDGDCYQAFIKRGYTWGGNWKKSYRDFHHFEKKLEFLNTLVG